MAEAGNGRAGFLKARADAEDARIKRELALQKLSALGLGEAEITALSKGRVELSSLRLREVRAPIKSRVIERKAEGKLSWKN